jgi:hypothetical protein
MDDRETQAAQVAVEAIHQHVGQLDAALATWDARDDTRPCPAARHAANDAMDAIDGALQKLYALRARLTGEIRASDDASARRVDELLARPRSGAP